MRGIIVLIFIRSRTQSRFHLLVFITEDKDTDLYIRKHFNSLYPPPYPGCYHWLWFCLFVVGFCLLVTIGYGFICLLWFLFVLVFYSQQRLTSVVSVW